MNSSRRDFFKAAGALAAVGALASRDALAHAPKTLNGDAPAAAATTPIHAAPLRKSRLPAPDAMPNLLIVDSPFQSFAHILPYHLVIRQPDQIISIPPQKLLCILPNRRGICRAKCRAICR